MKGQMQADRSRRTDTDNVALTAALPLLDRCNYGTFAAGVLLHPPDRPRILKLAQTHSRFDCSYPLNQADVLLGAAEVFAEVRDAE